MISIVIPLYNREHIICQTINSVLSQSYENFELIIVNDGSTDNSFEIVKNNFRDSRIKVIDQKNQGVSVARNTGVKASSFEYIAFLDADDEWKPDFLVTILKAIDKFPEAAIYGTSSLHTDYETGQFVDSTVTKFKNLIVEVNCFQNIHLLPHTSAIVVRKSSLYKIDENLDVFPVGMKMHQDWACFFRLALIDTVIYVGIPLGIRYNNVKGQVTGVSFRKRSDVFPSVIRYYNLMVDFYISNKCYNRFFWPFLRYKLRGVLKTLLLLGMKDSVDLFCKDLRKGILTNFEIRLYTNKNSVNLSLLFINFNKVYLRLTNPLFSKV